MRLHCRNFLRTAEQCGPVRSTPAHLFLLSDSVRSDDGASMINPKTTSQKLTHPKSITPRSLKGLFSAFLVLSCLPAFQARAGDYEVAYAINARGVTEKGKSTECTYRDPCKLKLENSSITIIIHFRGFRRSPGAFRAERRSYDIYIHGQGNCCYFADADDRVSIDDNGRLRRFPIFEGRRRHRNEYVMNRRIGELFLAFWSLTPAPQPPPPALGSQPTRW
jgi:hypothetical protein